MLEEDQIDAKMNIVDLGTGNGHFLFELYSFLEEGSFAVDFNYHGIDYSPDSVEFAQKIARKKYPSENFVFEVVDFLDKNCDYLDKNRGKFDVIFDKGTLDAIALNNDPVDGFEGKIGIEVYPIQVVKLMHEGSLLVITSCNFTEDELIKLVTQNGTNNLLVRHKLKYPSFQFGGNKGSTICSIVFTR